MMRVYFLLSLCPFFFYLVLKMKKVFQVLQQNWYNLDERNLKWILENRKKVFLGGELFFLIVSFIPLILNAYFSMIFFGIFYLVLAILEKKKKEQVKKPLVFTKRVLRLTITLIIVFLCMLVPILLTFTVSSLSFYYFVLGLFCYLAYFISNVLVWINTPIEKYVYHYFLKKAKQKLKSMEHMKVIGITGSYGKTSSKNILNDILNIKYLSFPTPKNFNTTYGLMLTINNYLDKFNDYLIAEMGAFKRGEIKELCDFVHPTYGILTTIGTAHLESFGSRENIQKGKFELIESLPEDGIGILNRDDPYQVSYKLKNDCKIKWVGIDSEDVDLRATNIKPSASGTTFDAIFKGDSKKYSFSTKLLGTHNVYNILAAVLLGHELGIEIADLQRAVSLVNPVEHRLELKHFGNIHLIDDAYNSNPVGSERALEVLSFMKGKKMIVTPGMIELGDLQEKLNKEFGKKIAKTVDEVILIGREQTKPIQDGLLEEHFKEEHIHILNDVKGAFPLMNELSEGEETYVLLENDLPDIFNE